MVPKNSLDYLTLTTKSRGCLTDAQKFIIELNTICAVGLLLSFGWDLVPNLFHLVGLSATSHPFSFGFLQMAGTAFFAVMLARSLNYSRYYFP